MCNLLGGAVELVNINQPTFPVSKYSNKLEVQYGCTIWAELLVRFHQYS